MRREFVLQTACRRNSSDDVFDCQRDYVVGQFPQRRLLLVAGDNTLIGKRSNLSDQLRGQWLDILFGRVSRFAAGRFDQVLNVAGKTGTPFVDGAAVSGVVRGDVKGTKLYVQKFKRRKNYRRRTGHRQTYTRVEITEITV